MLKLCAISLWEEGQIGFLFRQIKKYILKLKEEGKLILISSHNSDDIESLCDYIYEIEEGKLVPL